MGWVKERGQREDPNAMAMERHSRAVQEAEERQRRREEKAALATKYASLEEKWKARGLADGDVFPLFLSDGRHAYARVSLRRGGDVPQLLECDERGMSKI